MGGSSIGDVISSDSVRVVAGLVTIAFIESAAVRAGMRLSCLKPLFSRYSSLFQEMESADLF